MKPLLNRILAILALFIIIIIALSMVVLRNKSEELGLACHPIKPNSTNQTPESTIFESTYSLMGGLIYGVETDGNYAYINAGRIFLVLDVQDPSQPEQIGFVQMPAIIRSIKVNGEYAYVGTEIGLYVIDISNPASPKLVGCPVGILDDKVVDDDKNVYATNLGNGLHILEKSESGILRELSVYNPPQPPPTIRILPKPVWRSSPIRISTVGVAIRNEYLYTLEGSVDDAGFWTTALRVLDITNPQRPSSVEVHKNLFEYSFDATRLLVHNDNLFLTGAGFTRGASTFVMDISNPSDPGLTDTVLPNNLLGFSGEYAYFAPNGFELEIWHLPDLSSPSMVSVISFLENPNDIAFSENNLFVVIPGQGLQIFDVTDKSQPKKVSSFTTVYSRWGPDVLDQKAFLFSGNTLQIIDLTDPAQQTILSSTVYRHSIFDTVVNGSSAYLTAGRRGLLKVNILDPTNPVIEATYISEDSSTILVTADESHVYIVNDSNTLEIVTASSTSPNSFERIDVFPIETDHIYDIVIMGNYLYLSTAEDQLLILDVSDPENTVQVGIKEEGGQSKLAANDKFLFVAKDNMINVFDISQPTNPTFVEAYQLPISVNFITLDGDKLYAFSNVSTVVLTLRS